MIMVLIAFDRLITLTLDVIGIFFSEQVRGEQTISFIDKIRSRNTDNPVPSLFIIPALTLSQYPFYPLSNLFVSLFVDQTV